jgi:hypothetical protein
MNRANDRSIVQASYFRIYMAQYARLDQFDHPSWLSAAGTILGYLAILIGMFVLLFVIPYLLFLPFSPV